MKTQNHIVSQDTSILQTLESGLFYPGLFFIIGAGFGAACLFCSRNFFKSSEPETPQGNIHQPVFLDPDNRSPEPKDVVEVLSSPEGSEKLKNALSDITFDAKDITTAKETCAQLLSRLDTFASRTIFEDLPYFHLDTSREVERCVQSLSDSVLTQGPFFELVVEVLPVLVCADYVLEILKTKLAHKFNPSSADNIRLQEVLERSEPLREEKYAIFRLFSTAVDPSKLLGLLKSPSKAAFKEAVKERKTALGNFLNNSTQQRGNMQSRYNISRK